MLQATVFPVGIARRLALLRIYQAQFAGDAQEGDVAQIAGQFGILMGVAEHQILDDKFDIDDAAGVLLEIKPGCAAWR